MIKWAYNEYGAPVTRLTTTMAADSEAFTPGEVVKLSSTGRWTKAATTDVPAGICNQTLAAGTSQTLDVTQIREGDVFNADYTGTPAAGFVAGVNAVVLDSTGLLVNSATVTGGAIAVLEVNSTKSTCRIKFKQRQLS